MKCECERIKYLFPCHPENPDHTFFRGKTNYKNCKNRNCEYYKDLLPFINNLNLNENKDYKLEMCVEVEPTKKDCKKNSSPEALFTNSKNEKDRFIIELKKIVNHKTIQNDSTFNSFCKVFDKIIYTKLNNEAQNLLKKHPFVLYIDKPIKWKKSNFGINNNQLEEKIVNAFKKLKFPINFSIDGNTFKLGILSKKSPMYEGFPSGIKVISYQGRGVQFLAKDEEIELLQDFINDSNDKFTNYFENYEYTRSILLIHGNDELFDSDIEKYLPVLKIHESISEIWIANYIHEIVDEYDNEEITGIDYKKVFCR